MHEPGAPEIQPDEALQARLDRGTQVGLVARTHVPGGALIEGPYHAYAERIAATDSALRRGAPVIYGASFRASEVFVSVDILERRPEGTRLIRGEVDDQREGSTPARRGRAGARAASTGRGGHAAREGIARRVRMTQSNDRVGVPRSGQSEW